MTEGQDPRLEAVARAIYGQQSEQYGGFVFTYDQIGPYRRHRLLAQARAALAAADAVAGEAETVKANAYQIIGSLADHAGLFVHPEIIRALDYFAYDKCGDDILPWPREALPAERGKWISEEDAAAACVEAMHNLGRITFTQDEGRQVVRALMLAEPHT